MENDLTHAPQPGICFRLRVEVTGAESGPTNSWCFRVWRNRKTTPVRFEIGPRRPNRNGGWTALGWRRPRCCPTIQSRRSSCCPVAAVRPSFVWWRPTGARRTFRCSRKWRSERGRRGWAAFATLPNEKTFCRSNWRGWRWRVWPCRSCCSTSWRVLRPASVESFPSVSTWK